MRSWPIRVRVAGDVKLTPINAALLAPLYNPAQEQPEAADFLQAAHFAKAEGGVWHVTYQYDPRGPTWRIEASRVDGR